MRKLCTVPTVAAVLTFVLGTSVAAVAPVYEAETRPVHGITGSMMLDPATSRGEFSVSEGVFEYRAVPLTGAPVTDDPRLIGQLESTWNWDVLRTGTEPVPAWGTMRIDVPPLATFEEDQLDAGAWAGTFTAIRRHDGEPFMVRAFLVGEGAYDGLCAVLDIEAGTSAWMIDGVVHRLPMQG